MKQKIQQLMQRLENSRFAPLIQFVKFGLVGVSNTAISYGIEMLCYYFLMRDAQFEGIRGVLMHLGVHASSEQVKIAVVTAIAFVVSVTNSFYWNSRYVFQQGEKRTAGQGVRAYLKTMASYAVTGVVLSPAIKMWLTGMGMPYYLSSILSLVVTIPLNFVLNKFWAFRDSKGSA